jgi:hypothetical protein
MIDDDTLVIAIATVSTIGFGFQTAIPALLSVRQSINPPGQDELIRLFLRRATNMGSFVSVIVTRPIWLYAMFGISTVYMLAALFDLVSLLPDYLRVPSFSGAPSALHLSLYVLIVGLSATLVSWLALLASAAVWHRFAVRRAVEQYVRNARGQSDDPPTHPRTPDSRRGSTIFRPDEGIDAVPPPSDPSFVPEGARGSVESCKRCGKAINAEDRYCRTCGQKSGRSS